MKTKCSRCNEEATVIEKEYSFCVNHALESYKRINAISQFFQELRNKAVEKALKGYAKDGRTLQELLPSIETEIEEEALDILVYRAYKDEAKKRGWLQ